MERKNILYISHYVSTHTGSPRALIDLIVNLKKERFNTHLLVPEWGELAEVLKRFDTNILVKNLLSLSKRNVPQFIYNTIELTILFRKYRIDLLHVNGEGWRNSYILAAYLLGIPIVLHMHNPYPTSEIKKDFNLYFANTIIVVSNSMKSSFEKNQTIYRKLVCIHNGVDLNKFKREKIADSNLGINKNLFVIGFVGQIRKGKGLEYLIEASPGILRAFPDTVFWVVGQDGIGEEGLTDRMTQFTKQLGVEKSFRFFGKRDDIPSIMNRIDLLTVPSLAEAFGKVIIEGMACRKCVIASNVGGIPEIIRDGENGILIPPGDCKKLEQSILSIMRNDELRMRLAESGYKTAKDRFAIERVVKKTEDLYMELISQRKESEGRTGATQE